MEDSAGTLVWVALAAVLEACFYFSMAWEKARERWTREWLVALAPVSYLVYSVALGVFSVQSLLMIAAGAAVAAYWFRALPRRRWVEVGYVVLVAAPILFKVFPFVYARAGDVRMDSLGQLLWIRVGVITVLREMQPEGVGFGFWPRAREWKIGAAHYAVLLPVVFALAAVTGFAKFQWPASPWWETALRAVGTFLGILWVVALSEEFFFRGLLQRWIGIVGASVLFGMAHLGFRVFPNWKFAVVAGVAGVFYGLAYSRAGGIRASMVAHALTVATWRVLFK